MISIACHHHSMPLFIFFLPLFSSNYCAVHSIIVNKHIVERNQWRWKKRKKKKTTERKKSQNVNFIFPTTGVFTCFEREIFRYRVGKKKKSRHSKKPFRYSKINMKGKIFLKEEQKKICFLSLENSFWNSTFFRPGQILCDLLVFE